ncbi:hypothetical protein E3Q13_01027 [Wallemia mellicola]|nr:hypothetical protein E3Q13_01027 [Wallemia mellicola]
MDDYTINESFDNVFISEPTRKAIETARNTFVPPRNNASMNNPYNISHNLMSTQSSTSRQPRQSRFSLSALKWLPGAANTIKQQSIPESQPPIQLASQTHLPLSPDQSYYQQAEPSTSYTQFQQPAPQQLSATHTKDAVTEVTLTNWYIMRHISDQGRVGVAVGGYELDFSNSRKSARSKFFSIDIHKRTTETELIGSRNIRVNLIGMLSSTGCQGFPESVDELFASGFPENWKTILTRAEDEFYIGKLKERHRTIHSMSKVPENDISVKMEVDDLEIDEKPIVTPQKSQTTKLKEREARKARERRLREAREKEEKELQEKERREAREKKKREAREKEKREALEKERREKREKREKEKRQQEREKEKQKQKEKERVLRKEKEKHNEKEKEARRKTMHDKPSKLASQKLPVSSDDSRDELDLIPSVKAKPSIETLKKRKSAPMLNKAANNIPSEPQGTTPTPFTDLFTQRIHGIDKRKSRGPTNLFDEPNSPFRKLAEDQGLTFELPEHESVTFERNYLKRKKRDREEKEKLESVKRKKEDEEEQIRQEKIRQRAERQWYKEEEARLKMYNDQKRLFEVEQKKKEEQEQVRREEQKKERLRREEQEQERRLREEKERLLEISMQEKELEDHREAEERNANEKERLEGIDYVNQAQTQDMESHQWWLNTMVKETNEEQLQTDRSPQREKSTQVGEPKDIVQDINPKSQNIPPLSIKEKSQELEDQPNDTLQYENTEQEMLTSPMIFNQPEFSFESRGTRAFEQNISVEQPTNETPLPPVIPINSQLSQYEKSLDVDPVELQKQQKLSGGYEQEQADELQQDWSRQMNEELREQMDDYRNGPMQMFEIEGGLGTDLQNDEVVQTVEMNRSPVLKHRFLSSNMEEDDQVADGQIMREKSNSIAHVDEQLADSTPVNDVASVSDSEDDDTNESANEKATNAHSEAGSPQDRSLQNEKAGENLLESAKSIMKNLAFETIGGRSLRPRPKARYSRESKPTIVTTVNSNTFPRKVRVRPIRHYMSFSDEE